MSASPFRQMLDKIEARHRGASEPTGEALHRRPPTYGRRPMTHLRPAQRRTSAKNISPAGARKIT